jgi:formylglycine-generating enzyme required for sulfatase activity
LAENVEKRLAENALAELDALAKMGRMDGVWPRLKHYRYPTVRSYLIERLGPAGVDLKVLAAQLDQEPDASIRRAIVLSLGQFDEVQLRSGRQQWVARLLEMYRDDPDAGIHGAAEWVLRSWKEGARVEESDRKLATGKVEGQRQWYVTRQGQTMVVVPAPGEVSVGEGPQAYKRRIDWRFAIAAKDVTVEQFLQFCRDRRKDHKYLKQYAPTADCPVHMVAWYEAAEYCNWLSEQEGIAKEQWCYLPNDQGKFAQGMKLAPNYLQREGYRLPSEAEWEHACRAGSVTAWSCGSTEDLLEKYAWLSHNSSRRSHPVGTLKPNDLGLFDMHGNVWQWCQEALGRKEDKEYIKDQIMHVLRGGSFINPAVNLRSAHRGRSVPSSRTTAVGFRPARTLTP